MFKSTLLFAIALITFSSCSDDSQADRWVGDDYKGSVTSLCTTPMVTEVFEEVSVSADGDNLTVNFKSSSASLKGTIDEFDQVEMEATNLILEDGRTLVLVEGSGNFEISTNNSDQRESKVLSIFYKLADTDECLVIFTFGEL